MKRDPCGTESRILSFMLRAPLLSPQYRRDLDDVTQGYNRVSQGRGLARLEVKESTYAVPAAKRSRPITVTKRGHTPARSVQRCGICHRDHAARAQFAGA